MHADLIQVQRMQTNNSLYTYFNVGANTFLYAYHIFVRLAFI